MNFGNLRSTITAALENPERIDHVVYVLLGPMEEHEREVAMNYAKSHLEGVEVGTVDLWDLVVWCVGMASKGYSLNGTSMKRATIRSIATDTAWGVAVAYSHPSEKRPLFTVSHAGWGVTITNAAYSVYRHTKSRTFWRNSDVDLVAGVSLIHEPYKIARPEIPSHLH